VAQTSRSSCPTSSLGSAWPLPRTSLLQTKGAARHIVCCALCHHGTTVCIIISFTVNELSEKHDAHRESPRTAHPRHVSHKPRTNTLKKTYRDNLHAGLPRVKDSPVPGSGSRNSPPPPLAPSASATHRHTASTQDLRPNNGDIENHKKKKKEGGNIR